MRLLRLLGSTEQVDHCRTKQVGQCVPRLGLAIALVATLLSGCASVTNDKVQNVRVQAFGSDGREITGAACRMENNFGVYRFTVPATVIVYKSKQDLSVQCDAIGYESVRLSVESGSPIHYLASRSLDLAQSFTRSTAYFYPEVVHVQFGALHSQPKAKVVKPTNGSLIDEIKEIGVDLGILKDKQAEPGEVMKPTETDASVPASDSAQ